MPWTIDWVGNATADNLLEEGEKAEITVWLLERDYAVAIGTAGSASLWVEDANGGFSRLAVCDPENHPDGSH